MVVSRHANKHAIVLGASMGGLLAARALHEHFGRVALIDRDELPTDVRHRTGVPQGRHTHGLLAKGAEVLEGYFPGLTAALVAEGVPTGDPGLLTRMIAGGRRCQPCETGRRALTVSRPLLEGHVRGRLLALPGVEALDQHDVLGLEVGDDGQRVTGVRIAPRRDKGAERLLEADLVVDATGRASKTPEWLRQLGFPMPDEEVVKIGMSYTTRHFRRRPTDAGGDLAIIVSATPPIRRVAAALAQEGDRWTVTLAGYLGERAPTDLAGFVEFALGLPVRDVYDLIKDAEPLDDGITASFPTSVRRRYEKVRRFPERYVVVADGVCSFNPVYGQGMSVAAVEATLLEAVIGEGLDRVGRRFFARAAEPIDVPWGIAVGNDLRFPEVEGPRSLGGRIINAYMGRFLEAAAFDPVLSRAFFEVSNLAASPAQLMSPPLLSRVFLRRSRIALSETEQEFGGERA